LIVLPTAMQEEDKHYQGFGAITKGHCQKLNKISSDCAFHETEKFFTVKYRFEREVKRTSLDHLNNI